MKGKLLTALAGASLAGAANAADVTISSDITTSTTWTADNVYNLDGQIYVDNMATLTIEAGTVVASTTGSGGSLAVTRGSKIFVEGTAQNPVIMTSTADVATWVGGNPKTGTWRASALEWGNLTLMGNAYISEDATPGNSPTPSASNVATMEGLEEGFPGDDRILYGGGDDDDDSGSISHLSLRYGGKVLTVDVELNGLSLGGIGRGTDIDYVEIMNNVDDGIEIWGGTVALRHFNIWNIGDDSFDVDQGWRGSAQFGLIVQGYSLDDSQGSGVGDNCFETDGAEDSDFQPVTTATIYNVTVVGNPGTSNGAGGDGATAWRDNARVQYRNCVFMDIGDEAVRFDGDDGDGASGYGHNGTLSWADHWTTSYTQTSAVNPFGSPAAIADAYQSQCDYSVAAPGKLCEIKDSVFYNVADYTDADARDVFDPNNNNVKEAANLPIRSYARGPEVLLNGNTLAVEPVIAIDPRPANDALASVVPVCSNGKFTPVSYRGGFDPETNWLCNWTATDAFGFLTEPAAAATILSDPSNVPGSISPNGLPTVGNAAYGFTIDNPTGSCGVIPGSPALVLTSLGKGNGTGFFPIWGCGGGSSTLFIDLFNTFNPAVTGGVYVGAPFAAPLPIPNNGALCGFSFTSQVIFSAVGIGPRLGNAVVSTIGA